MLLDSGFDELEGVEGRVAEVAVTVDVTLVGIGVGVAAFCGDFFGFVLATVVDID